MGAATRLQMHTYPILTSNSSLVLGREASGPVVGANQRVTGAVWRPSCESMSFCLGDVIFIQRRKYLHKQLLGVCEFNKSKEVRRLALLVRSLAGPLGCEHVVFFLERHTGHAALLRVDGIENDADAVISRAGRDELVEGRLVQPHDA